jgi:hypothetical protein
LRTTLSGILRQRNVAHYKAYRGTRGNNTFPSPYKTVNDRTYSTGATQGFGQRTPRQLQVQQDHQNKVKDKFYPIAPDNAIKM